MATDSLDLTTLARAFRGELIAPGDATYDEARAVYNAMIDRRPALVARCRDVADVIAAVTFGREQGLTIAVRGGGHSAPGLGTVDDGLVIDLSPMNGVRVDPETETARVEGGATWGDVDHATHPFGLAAVSGVISTTGVGGLTLGGGHGYLSRQYGLTIDNLLSADVVLADGRLVQASEAKHRELFWALRGGGGNFGVVTSFEFRLHPVENVIAGPMLWPVEDLEDVLRWYRDWLPRAPEDVYACFMTGEVLPAEPPFPEAIHGRKVCGLVWCCTGDEAAVEPHLEAARDAAAPLFEHVGEVPYPMLQSVFDPFYPPGLHSYWKGDFFDEISDEAIAVHRRFAEVPTTRSLMHLYPVDGAVQRVASDATAWRRRDAVWSMVILGVDPDAGQGDRLRDWARDYWQALHPHSLGDSYVNFMMEEGAERVKATYGDNLDRLRRAKHCYDPDNLFRRNQNIEPLASKEAGE